MKGKETAKPCQTRETKGASLSAALAACSRLGPADWKPVIADRKQNCTWFSSVEKKIGPEPKNAEVPIMKIQVMKSESSSPTCTVWLNLFKTEGPVSPQGSLTDTLKLSAPPPKNPSITPPPFRWSL